MTAAFDYVRPRTLAEALARLSARDDAQLLAGGMTLIPALKHGLASPGELVDIGRLPELQGIRDEGDGLVVGAGCRHAAVADDALLRSRIPALANLAGSIGDPQVRHRGTLGGAVANNDPAADYPAAVLGLGATVRTDRREIDADAFFVDLFTTALEPGEIITAIRFPVARVASYRKCRHPASGYAMAGVFVACFGPAAAPRVRVAVTGAAACVFRHAAAEQALQARFAVEALQGIHCPTDRLNDDFHAPPVYRAHLVDVLLADAVTAILNAGDRP